MEIAIQILKNRLQSLKEEKNQYKSIEEAEDGRSLDPVRTGWFIGKIDGKIEEVRYLIQRLEIEGRRKQIEEKEFQDSLGRFNG